MMQGNDKTAPGAARGDFRWADAAPAAWIAAILLRDRRTILAAAATGLILALTVALLRPAFYTSSFSLLPQTSQDPSRSGLASIAGQLGVQIGSPGGGAQPPQLYADLVKTRELLSGIAVARFPVAAADETPTALAAFLEVDGDDSAVVREHTMRVLREEVVSASVAARTTGAVTVTVRTRSPYVSLGIAQQLLDGLNRFNVETRQSQAGEERRFIERRLRDAESSLRQAEDALQRFMQSNRQFANAPQLAFQHERLQRDVSLQQQVVTGLAQQYEEARIREVRDTPVITVIERPTLPVLPDPRGRAVTVILGLIFGLLAGIGAVVARAGWERQRSSAAAEPAYLMLDREWQRFRGTAPRA